MNETLKHIYDLLKTLHLSCYDFNHSKKDQHKPDEICKPLQNFEQILECLRQAIEEPEKQWQLLTEKEINYIMDVSEDKFEVIQRVQSLIIEKNTSLKIKV
jgi:hypothetical protein